MNEHERLKAEALAGLSAAELFALAVRKEREEAAARFTAMVAGYSAPMQQTSTGGGR